MATEGTASVYRKLDLLREDGSRVYSPALVLAGRGGGLQCGRALARRCYEGTSRHHVRPPWVSVAMRVLYGTD